MLREKEGSGASSTTAKKERSKKQRKAGPMTGRVMALEALSPFRGCSRKKKKEHV
jgi:hypothetical protein